MECSRTDILQEVPTKDWSLLRDFYKQHIPHATHVYSFFDTMVKWTKKMPDREFLTVYAPDGDWKSDGTFIALMQWSCYDLFVFTMDPTCERLYRGLKETRTINYVDNAVMFYGVHQKHYTAVLRALEESKIPIHYRTKTDIYWMPKEESSKLTFVCPEGYYIDILKREHAPIINELWTHRFEGSVGYVTTFIEMGGGHGIFTKSENKLVSWIIKNQMGTLGLLQTLEDHKRKGLARVITKSLSKEIGLEGHNPLGTVLQDNVASKSMFTNLGFKVLDWCMYIGAGKEEYR